MIVCINYKCYNTTELMCLKELILVKSVVRMSELFAITATFQKLNFRFQAIVCDVCHGLMQKVTGLNDVAIVYVEKMIIEFIFCI